MAKHEKRFFFSRGVLEENSLNLNDDFGKVILYTNLRCPYLHYVLNDRRDVTYILVP